MTTTMLRPTYPCGCGARARLAAIHTVPRQRYERTCPRCNINWTITRETMREGAIRMDRLEWQTTTASDGFAL